MVAWCFGLVNGWLEAEYPAEWLAQGLRIAPNGWHKAWVLLRMAANGLSTRKQQSNGNLGIAPANWKKCSTAIDGSRRPKKMQRGNWRIALVKRKKLRRGNQGIAPAFSEFAGGLEYRAEWLARGLDWSIPLNGWREAWSIAPNGWREAEVSRRMAGARLIVRAWWLARSLEYRAEWLARAWSIVPNGWHEAYLLRLMAGTKLGVSRWMAGTRLGVSCLMAGAKLGVSRRMAGARLVDRAEGWREAWGSRRRLAKGLRMAPNGWCEDEYCAEWWHEANIALNGGARLILRSMVARGLYRARWWRKSNIALDGGASLISRLMVARGWYRARWWREADITLDGGARLISRSMVAQGLQKVQTSDGAPLKKEKAQR
jgi:hypothetical protein